MDRFTKYLPLFIEKINNKEIGVCKWIESGDTIDSAVPGLYDMTNDKESWRAIIVHEEDEDCMSEFERKPENPFDFLINETSGERNILEENPVPLVRLTNMLGGLPAYEIRFESKVVQEDGKAPRTIYIPQEDEEEKYKYEELRKKYEFNGKTPSAIILISIRHNYRSDDNSIDVWQVYRESQSSEFWKRNHYPSPCRFLSFDFSNEGPIERTAEEFRFWSSVMMIAGNEVDSGTLQAYRLYNLNVQLDKDRMAETFQETIARLNETNIKLENQIEAETRAKLTVKSVLPKFRYEVPVELELPEDAETYVEENRFHLFSNGRMSDYAAWNEERSAAENALEKSIKQVNRILDKTAAGVRYVATYDPEQVAPLDAFQKEDLQDEADRIYEHIVVLQGELPEDTLSGDERIKENAQEVNRYLKGRVEKDSAKLTFAAAITLVLLANIPALIDWLWYARGNLTTILVTTFVEILVVLLCGFVMVLMQKSELAALIESYNGLLRRRYEKLTHDASDYQDYMSEITSLSRGRSYLRESERIIERNEQVFQSKYAHIRAISILKSKIRDWSEAFHISVEMEERAEQYRRFDTDIEPNSNELYTFEREKEYRVRINDTGAYLQSPVGFIKKIIIKREELYDNGNR